jgi:S-adenosylmethionine hydrolase
MPIITLITDWHNHDHYLSALKGKLLGQLPDVRIIDITHQIPAFGYIRAAFVLRNCYRSFPPGTIHMVGVNSEASKQTPHVVIAHEGQYFIGADNGIFGLMFNTEPEKAVKLVHNSESTFPEYDIFAEVAIFLSKSGNFDELGPVHDKLHLPSPLLATIDETIINGSVIYIDSYSNAITNINRNIFEKTVKNRRFEILVQSNHYKINKINKFYHETAKGDLLAVFNSSGLLEIAVNNGNAAELMSLNLGSIVRVKIYDTPEREELKLL